MSIIDYSTFSKLTESEISAVITFYSTAQKVHILLQEYTGAQIVRISKYQEIGQELDKHMLYDAGNTFYELHIATLPYLNFKEFLLRVILFIKENGFTKNNNEIILNVSVPHMHLNHSLNRKKLALLFLTGDTNQYFPTSPRIKSTVNMLQLKDDLFNKIMPANELYALELFTPTKRGLNLSKLKLNKVSFYFLSGRGYEKNGAEIIKALDDYILKITSSINTPITKKELELLKPKLIILNQKSEAFLNLKNFKEYYPNIKLSVDLKTEEQIINTYFTHFRRALINFFDNIGSSYNCQINYNTDMSKVEIKNLTYHNVYNAKDLIFLTCNLSGEFMGCTFHQCTLTNSYCDTSTFFQTTIKDSKIVNSKLYGSQNTGVDNIFINTKIDEAKFSQSILLNK